MQINFSGFFNELFSNTGLRVLAYVCKSSRFHVNSELVPCLPSVPVRAPWKQTGHVTAGHWSKLESQCASVSILGSFLLQFRFSGWLVFFYLISLCFACNTLRFCQTAEGTSPLYYYA